MVCGQASQGRVVPFSLISLFSAPLDCKGETVGAVENELNLIVDLTACSRECQMILLSVEKIERLSPFIPLIDEDVTDDQSPINLITSLE